MKLIRTERGFEILLHPAWPVPGPDEVRLLQQSSVIGDYPNSFDLPGSSYLYVGEHHSLNREEVAQLILHLQRWLATGSMDPDQPPDSRNFIEERKSE